MLPERTAPRVLVERGPHHRRRLRHLLVDPEPVRLQPHRRRRRPEHAFHNAERVIRFERDRRAVPRGVAAGAVPRRTTVHPVLEHVLRHGPLRRHHRRVRPAVPEAAGGVPAVAQHVRRDDGAGDRRLRPVPADATPPARRAVRRLRRGVHRERPAARRREGSGSSTRSKDYGGPWSFDSEAVADSPTSTRRCRACTSAGRCGARSRCGRCCAADGNESRCSSIRWRRCSASSSRATTTGSTGSPGSSSSASGRSSGGACIRWNQNRLDAKHARTRAATSSSRRRLTPRPATTAETG